MMLHTTYQGPMPCGFRQEDFFTFFLYKLRQEDFSHFFYISLCETYDHRGEAIFDLMGII